LLTTPASKQSLWASAILYSLLSFCASEHHGPVVAIVAFAFPSTIAVPVKLLWALTSSVIKVGEKLGER
jgi:hypothetical protein